MTTDRNSNTLDPNAAGPAVQVRRMTPADIETLWAMNWSPLVKERDTFYLVALFMQGRWAYIAEIDGEPAGVLLACSDDAQRRLYINHLLVFNEYRGSGVGTVLMDRLEGEARRAGIRRIWLLTSSAQGFYERRGYRVCQEELPAALQAFVERVKRMLVMVREV